MQPDCSKLLKILKTFCMAQTIKTTFELKDIKTFDFQRCVLQKLEFQETPRKKIQKWPLILNIQSV